MQMSLFDHIRKSGKSLPLPKAILHTAIITCLGLILTILKNVTIIFCKFSSLVNRFFCLLGYQLNTGHFHSVGDAPFFTCFFERHIVHIYTSGNIYYYISFSQTAQGRKYE